MSLAVHILVTVSFLVIFGICLWNTDFIRDNSKTQSIKEELAEIKPLLSEDMYKRVSDDARSGYGVFARYITVSEKKLSIKDKVLLPVMVVCGLAFWPSVASTIFNLSWQESLVAVIVGSIVGLLGIVMSADLIE